MCLANCSQFSARCSGWYLYVVFCFYLFSHYGRFKGRDIRTFTQQRQVSRSDLFGLCVKLVPRFSFWISISAWVINLCNVGREFYPRLLINKRRWSKPDQCTEHITSQLTPLPRTGIVSVEVLVLIP